MRLIDRYNHQAYLIVKSESLSSYKTLLELSKVDKQVGLFGTTGALTVLFQTIMTAMFAEHSFYISDSLRDETLERVIKEYGGTVLAETQPGCWYVTTHVDILASSAGA